MRYYNFILGPVITGIIFFWFCFIIAVYYLLHPCQQKNVDPECYIECSCGCMCVAEAELQK